MQWLALLAEAIACSAMLFVAHGFAVNTKYLEPRMSRGDRLAFVLALFYYAALLLVPILLSHQILLK